MSVWLKRLSRWWKKRTPEPTKTPKLAHRRSRYRSVTRIEYSFDVPCTLVDPPTHPVHVLIVDRVVKAIDTPCDLSAAAAVHLLSHDKTCAEPCARIKQYLAGHSGMRADPWSGNLLESSKKADQKRKLRKPSARREYFRFSPALWPAFFAKTTSISVSVSKILGTTYDSRDVEDAVDDMI